MASVFEKGYQLNEIMKVFLAYMDHKNLSDRMACIGSFAEITLALKNKIEPFAKVFIPLILRDAASNEEHLKRNSIYALGLLVLYVPHLLQDKFQMLMKLFIAPLEDPSHNEAVVVDNAVGAISRVVLCPQFQKEIDLNLCFNHIMANLPPRADFEEIGVVCQALVSLGKSNMNLFTPQILSRLKEILQNLVTSSLVKPDEKKTILETGKFFFK